MRSETQFADNASDYPSGGYPQGIILPDIDYLMGRTAVEDAHEYLGHLVVIRRKMRPEDNRDRCSLCYDAVLGHSSNPACPECWGTSFSGGYYLPEFTKAIFRNYRERLELTSRGYVRMISPSVTIGPSPKVRDGDLIIRVINTPHGLIERDRYYIDEVEWIEMAPSHQVIGQRFTVRRLLWDDPLNSLPIGGEAP